MAEKMPIPSRARCLNLGAAVLEAELHEMRRRSVQIYEGALEPDINQRPLGSSHEADLMKAVEWATAAATLRLLAEQAE